MTTVIKIKSTNFIKLVLIFILCQIALASMAFAEEEIQDLQQRANFAYEQMMKAKYRAELISMEVSDTEKALVRAKKSLFRAEQEAEASRKKFEEANLDLQQAQKKWDQASDALENRWKESQNNHKH